MVQVALPYAAVESGGQGSVLCPWEWEVWKPPTAAPLAGHCCSEAGGRKGLQAGVWAGKQMVRSPARPQGATAADRLAQGTRDAHFSHSQRCLGARVVCGGGPDVAVSGASWIHYRRESWFKMSKPFCSEMEGAVRKGRHRETWRRGGKWPPGGTSG